MTMSRGCRRRRTTRISNQYRHDVGISAEKDAGIFLGEGREARVGLGVGCALRWPSEAAGPHVVLLGRSHAWCDQCASSLDRSRRHALDQELTHEH
jgi:hypothetical protein